MTGFQCNMQGATGNKALGKPQIPRYCGADPAKGKVADPSNCTYGAKAPMWWLQAERNNMFEDAMDAPTYNDRYHFTNGAQTDIFGDTPTSSYPSSSSSVPANGAYVQPTLSSLTPGGVDKQPLTTPSPTTTPADKNPVQHKQKQPVPYTKLSSLHKDKEPCPTTTSSKHHDQHEVKCTDAPKHGHKDDPKHDQKKTCPNKDKKKGHHKRRLGDSSHGSHFGSRGRRV